jgi:hypothetical protein
LLRIALLALLALLGCEPEPPAELLEVSRVAATEVQFGDALQVSGDGFALGKPVLVRFRGRVYRPGLPPREVDIALDARSESQHELNVPLPRAIEAEFRGTDAAATHATFRGDLQVAIAASEAGAPPVTGTLHGAALELYPSLEARDVVEQRTALGRSALQFFGLEVSAAAGAGLAVSEVIPGGRAAQAGLQAGDRIVHAAGLNVLEPSDMVPPHARSLEIGVYRGGVPRSLVLDADGFRGLPPQGVNGAALLLGVAALCFVLWATPLPRLLGALAPAWLDQLRARWSAALARRRSGWELAGEALGGPLGTLIFLGVGAALLAPALRRTPIDQGLGLLALCFGSATLLLAASLIRGGSHAGRWSLRRGVLGAFQQLLVLAPAWIGFAAIALETGIDADEWLRSQGALPWSWNVFSNPGASALFLCSLLSALPQPGRPERLRHARGTAAPPAGLLESIYACSICALGALVFLGGGAGVTLGVGPERLAQCLIAWLEYAASYALLACLRGLAQRPTLARWAPLGIWLVLPGSLAALGLSRAWRALAARSEPWQWLLSGFGPLAVCALALLLPAALLGLRAVLRSTAAHPGLSPWL